MSPPLSLQDARLRLTAIGAPFEVGVEDVFGVPTKVYVHRPRSLRELLDRADGQRDRDHVVYGSQRLSMGDVLASAQRVAASLAAGPGIRRGDRVAILAANCPEWIITFWATVQLGAVAVGVNAWWKRDEILHALRDSGAAVLVADGPRLARIIADVEELRPQLRGAYEIGSTSRASSFVDSFGSLVGWGGGPAPRPVIGEDDAAVILYTSGTTGRSKGAVSTHRSMIANLQNTQFNAAVARERAGVTAAAPPTMLLTSPMFHVSGCHSGIVIAMASSAKVVLPVGRAEATKILQLIQDERVTTWPTVPTLALRVAGCPDRQAFDTSSLAAVAYGGSPSALEVQRRVQDAFPTVGGSIRNAYGLTESSSVATAIEGVELVERPGSVGRPVPVVDVRIVDESGLPVPPNQSGEIWLRGSTIMAGYWNNPVATAEALTPDRWLRTGDVGVLDDEGYLYVVDRLKDVIIRGGENIYSVEIENRLLEHPLIADAAAVGVPHAELGEEVLAVVQVVPGAELSATDVRSWVAQALADFKVPAHVRTTESPLPRNASGKLLKGVLRGAKDTALEELM